MPLYARLVYTPFLLKLLLYSKKYCQGISTHHSQRRPAASPQRSPPRPPPRKPHPLPPSPPSRPGGDGK